MREISLFAEKDVFFISLSCSSAAHDCHQNSSDRNNRSGKTKGGKSQSHQETGKRGEDFKENIKKEYGSYKRAKGDDVTGSRAEGNSEKTSDKKHFSHRKAGANKKKKNISKASYNISEL